MATENCRGTIRHVGTEGPTPGFRGPRLGFVFLSVLCAFLCFMERHGGRGNKMRFARISLNS